MAKKKKQETGGLQQPKLTVAEKEQVKQEREEVRKKEKKKREKKEKGERRGFFRWVKGIFVELKKVRWPTFSHTVAQTGVVLAVVLIFSLLVFGIDRGLTELYQLLTRNLA